MSNIASYVLPQERKLKACRRLVCPEATHGVAKGKHPVRLPKKLLVFSTGPRVPGCSVIRTHILSLDLAVHVHLANDTL